MSATRDDFERYDRQHPEVWEAFRRFAYQALAHGRSRFGAKAIMERVRWYTHFEGKAEQQGEADFKVCNTFTSFYARKLILEEDSFLDLFTLRRLHLEADPLFEAQQARRAGDTVRADDILRRARLRPPVQDKMF